MAEELDFEFDPDWKDVIGRFMVAFAECERWTHDCLDDLLSPRLAAVTRHLPFERRCQFTRAAIEDAALDLPAELVSELFRQMHVLANFRNIVAHNPPTTYFLFDEEVPASEAQWVSELRSVRNPKKVLSLEDVLGLTAEAERVHSSMQKVIRELAIRRFKLRTMTDANSPSPSPQNYAISIVDPLIDAQAKGRLRKSVSPPDPKRTSTRRR